MKVLAILRPRWIEFSNFMKNGKISTLTKHLHGAKTMTLEMPATDGFVERCKNKTRSKGKLKKKIT